LSEIEASVLFVLGIPSKPWRRTPNTALSRANNREHDKARFFLFRTDQAGKAGVEDQFGTNNTRTRKALKQPN